MAHSTIKLSGAILVRRDFAIYELMKIVTEEIVHFWTDYPFKQDQFQSWLQNLELCETGCMFFDLDLPPALSLALEDALKCAVKKRTSELGPSALELAGECLNLLLSTRGPSAPDSK
jgi:hypothetical protein